MAHGRRRIILSRVGGGAAAGLLVLWVASRFFGVQTWFDGWSVWIGRGVVWVSRYESPAATVRRRELSLQRPDPGDRWMTFWLNDPLDRFNAGVVATRAINGFGIRSKTLIIVLWPLPPLTAGLSIAAGWWGRRARRRATLAGVCQACGYTRGALPAGSACPECGAAP